MPETPITPLSAFEFEFEPEHSETKENEHRFVLLHFSAAFRLAKLPENWNFTFFFSFFFRLAHSACIGHHRVKRKTAFIMFQSVDRAERAAQWKPFATLHPVRSTQCVRPYFFLSIFCNEHKLDASLLEHGRLEEELTGKIVLRKKFDKETGKNAATKKKKKRCFMFSRYPLRLV